MPDDKIPTDHKSMDMLIQRLFNQINEQQRIIDRLITLLDELRSVAMGIKK